MVALEGAAVVFIVITSLIKFLARTTNPPAVKHYRHLQELSHPDAFRLAVGRRVKGISLMAFPFVRARLKEFLQ